MNIAISLPEYSPAYEWRLQLGWLGNKKSCIATSFTHFYTYRFQENGLIQNPKVMHQIYGSTLIYEQSMILIEKKGMTFDHTFDYSFPFSLPSLKNEGRRKGEWICKNRDQKVCLSARLGF